MAASSTTKSLDILRRASQKRGDVVGMDLVEVAPDYDHTGTTAFLAARVLLDFLGYIFHERGTRKKAK